MHRRRALAVKPSHASTRAARCVHHLGQRVQVHPAPAPPVPANRPSSGFTLRATVKPAAAPPMLRQLLASTYAAASAYRSAVISVTLSSAKVEKVVNAPQKPVPNARLARGPAPAPASPPIANERRTLSVQMAAGPMLRLLAAVCAPYRARAPPHAPAQTKPQSTSCGLRLGCSGDICGRQTPESPRADGCYYENKPEVSGR